MGGSPSTLDDFPYLLEVFDSTNMEAVPIFRSGIYSINDMRIPSTLMNENYVIEDRSGHVLFNSESESKK
jgi:hypothetical protein